jgi:putative hydrolase
MMDCHLHSKWTDGRCTIRELAEEAKALGLARIAVTDHVRRRSDYQEGYREEIRTVSRELMFDILTGFEAKAADFDGSLDLNTACRKLADLVIGSVHSLPDGNGFRRPETFPAGELARLECKAALGIIRGGAADVLGHPGGMSLALHGHFAAESFEALIAACAETRTAFELNSRYHKPVRKVLFDLLDHYNPYISFGSDAHRVAEMKGVVELINEARSHE